MGPFNTLKDDIKSLRCVDLRFSLHVTTLKCTRKKLSAFYRSKTTLLCCLPILNRHLYLARQVVLNSSLWRLSRNTRHKRECSAVAFAAKCHPKDNTPQYDFDPLLTLELKVNLMQKENIYIDFTRQEHEHKDGAVKICTDKYVITDVVISRCRQTKFQVS